MASPPKTAQPPPGGLSDIMAQVRRIEIMTGRLVAENFAGEYQSVFKGQGMEFAEVREYSPGDDVRTIDWNVTARMGRPFVRRYTEERELTVVLACDLSGSQSFGSGDKLKKEVAAELGAVLAFSALQNNDKVGLFIFTEGIEEYVPPKKGRRHVLHLIRELLAFEPARRGTRIGSALDTIAEVLRRRAIVFVISDFRDEGFERSLKRTALKHDVVPILVIDPREGRLPRLGAFLELEDPESGTRTCLNAGDSRALASLRGIEERRISGVEAGFKRLGLDWMRIATDGPLIDPIVRFFESRSRRLRR